MTASLNKSPPPAPARGDPLDEGEWYDPEDGDDYYCDHPNGVVVSDGGTYLACYCPDCDTEYEDSIA